VSSLNDRYIGYVNGPENFVAVVSQYSWLVGCNVAYVNLTWEERERERDNNKQRIFMGESKVKGDARLHVQR